MSSTDHTTRTLLIPKMQPDLLIVSRGSDSNMDDEAAQLDSGHSQVRSYNMTSFTTNATAMEFLEGKLLGWGLRNSVGVAQHPQSGGIWAVENSVDQLTRDNEDIHQNNPAEELNFLGYLNGSTEHQGGNYGYPYCYTLWSTQNFPELGSLTTGDQFPSGEVKNLTDNQCNDDYVDPRLAFQAHMAPLDIIFNTNGSTAYVSFHGSCKSDSNSAWCQICARHTAL
jgi:glucose/arabinose dehydrogenase